MADQVDEILMGLEGASEEGALIEDEMSTADMGFDLAADSVFAAVQAGDKAAFKAALKDALDAMLMAQGTGDDGLI